MRTFLDRIFFRTFFYQNVTSLSQEKLIPTPFKALFDVFFFYKFCFLKNSLVYLFIVCASGRPAKDPPRDSLRQTFDLHPGALVLSLSRSLSEDDLKGLVSSGLSGLHRLKPHQQHCVCLLSVGAPVLQLPHDDRDGGIASQREDVHLQEADPLPELDRSSHQKSAFQKPAANSTCFFLDLPQTISPFPPRSHPKCSTWASTAGRP